MANKRKLNRRQQWRIDKIQEERRDRANRKAAKLETQYEVIGEERSGLVIQHFGKSLDIEDRESGDIIRCSMRQNLGIIVCGDDVIWQSLKSKDIDSNSERDDKLVFAGVVVAVSPRRSLLARPDPYGQKKAIAANIDQILIICSPLPALNKRLIDRYLVAAEVNEIRPIIVLNKIDLLADTQLEELKQELQIYDNLNYQVLYTSVNQEQGLQSLNEVLADNNSIFVGQSGVGKSSLVNRILPQANAKTGAISEYSGKGKHTTSVASLYHLDSQGIRNGCLIDSPGIREFGLWDISPEEVDRGFKEIFHYSQDCRFRNCRHFNEPHCAILEAIDNNKIALERLQSYRQIIDSL